MTKAMVFQNAIQYFNTGAYPFVAGIQGDKLVFTWDWKNALIVGLAPSIKNEHAYFKCVVDIIGDKKYKITDISGSTTKSVGVNGISMKKDFRMGKQFGMNKTIAIGKDKNNNKVGVVTFDFDSRRIHGPVKQFLENCGLKKKGLF